MCKKSITLKALLVASLIYSSGVFAQIDCIPKNALDVEKQTHVPKHERIIKSKVYGLKTNKVDKQNSNYFGVLKLLIPNTLR